MLKKLIAGLQVLDTSISAPGFRVGAFAGATVIAVIAAAVIAIAVIAR